MKKITVSILTTLLMLSMVFSSSVFAANEEVSAWDSFLGLFSAKASATDVGVEYRGHIENKGDFPLDNSWIQGPTELGTRGESLRMEGFWIKLTDAPDGLNIKYNVHVQNEGWLADEDDTTLWAENGEFCGTTAKGQRIEAVKIVLVDDEGNLSTDYDVMYQGHVQNVGDLPANGTWFMNGVQLGTVGASQRLEALKVKIVQKEADLTAYEAAKAAVVQADYTAASWTAYKGVVDANVVDEDNLQSEVDAATAAITAAQANLVKVLKVESVSAMNAQELLVTFATVVDKNTAETTTNYVFNAANSSASNLVVATAKLQDDKKSVVLTLGTPNLNSKTAASYLGNIKNVTDVAGTKIIEYSQTLNLFDAVAPTVTGITYPDSNTIKVAFSEPVNTISTGIASATTIKLDGTTVVVPSSAYTLATDKKSFTINIATSGLVNSKNYEMTINGLTDFASNALVKYVGNITFAPDTTNPTVTALSAIDLSHLKVTFSEPIKNLSNNGFAVKIGTLNSGNPFTGDITNANTTTPDYKTFIFTMTSPASVAAGNYVVTVNNFQDTAGNPSNVATSTYTQELAFAVTKPAITSTVGTVKTIAGSQYVVYSFDRDVLVSGSVTGTYVKDSVTNTAPSLLLKDSTTLGIEKNEIAIAAPTSTGDYTISLLTTSVRDTFGNAIAKTDVTFTYGATQPATVSSVTQGNTSTTMDYVYVNLSKEVSNAALDYTKYTVDGVQVFNAATFVGDKAHLRLKLNSGAIVTTGSKTFAVSGISDITDISYDGSTPALAKIAFVENVKPVVQKVELVSLSNIRVTFSENVTAVQSAAADFEIKVNGAIVSASSTPLNNVVTLDLTNDLTTSTTPVTVAIATGSTITDAAGNLTEVGQLKTATVTLSDTKGLADAAITSAFAQFNYGAGNNTDGTVATGKTTATARTAYNAAVVAVDNHGSTATTLDLGKGATTVSYANALAWLKAAVLTAEAEDFGKTADLTNATNLATYDTMNDAAIATLANIADNVVGTNDDINTNITSRTGLMTTELGLVGTANTKYTDLVAAIDAVVATSGNTASNLAAAETAYDNAVAANTALTSLSAATKTKLTSDTTTQKARTSAVVTNIKLVQGASTAVVKATWGSDNGDLTLTDVTLGTVGYTASAGITGITVSNSTGAFSITGTATAPVTVTIPGTSNLDLFDTATVTSGAASIANGTATIVVAP